jgi:UDP-N-acetyl-2-amino-2-deoxyglucuronate dehydrogenase
VPIRTVVVGLGPMGQLHRLAASGNEDFVVIGGSDPDPARADGLPEGATFARDADELLRLTSPDLVVIATPPAVHAPIVRAALAGGSHVLCEKPLTIDSEEADLLTLAAAEAGSRICAVNLQLRFSPARQAMRRLVRDGSVGHLIGLRAVVASPGYHEIAPAWYRDLGRGGGVLMELGTHVLDQMLWLAGPIAWASGAVVPATSAGDDGQATDEDHVAVVVRFEGGHVGELTVSTIARSDPPRSLEVVGDRGTLRLVGETRLDLEAPGRPTTPVPLPEQTLRSLTGDPKDTYTQPLQRLYAHLANAVLRNGPFEPLATFADAAAVQAVIDRIRRAPKEDDPR